MGLVKLAYMGKVKFLTADGVTAITRWEHDGGSCTCVWYGPRDGQVVDGTPDEVHAALFPPEFIAITKEQHNKLAAAVSNLPPGEANELVSAPGASGVISQEQAMATLEQGAAYGGLSSDTWTRLGRLAYPSSSGLVIPADLAEALNPATYEQEWANHSPNCARAMAWALGLVRARLGVGT